ncbi:hypothetical protein SAMN05428954_0044 [Streptomyces sp. 2112.3]|nr:hypothetical protein SAMN05428954_0044 [Streptomyces sp. 2112.3]
MTRPTPRAEELVDSNRCQACRQDQLGAITDFAAALDAHHSAMLHRERLALTEAGTKHQLEARTRSHDTRAAITAPHPPAGPGPRAGRPRPAGRCHVRAAQGHRPHRAGRPAACGQGSTRRLHHRGRHATEPQQPLAEGDQCQRHGRPVLPVSYAVQHSCARAVGARRNAPICRVSSTGLPSTPQPPPRSEMVLPFRGCGDLLPVASGFSGRGAVDERPVHVEQGDSPVRVHEIRLLRGAERGCSRPIERGDGNPGIASPGRDGVSRQLMRAGAEPVLAEPRAGLARVAKGAVVRVVAEEQGAEADSAASQFGDRLPAVPNVGKVEQRTFVTQALNASSTIDTQSIQSATISRCKGCAAAQPDPRRLSCPTRYGSASAPEQICYRGWPRRRGPGCMTAGPGSRSG